MLAALRSSFAGTPTLAATLAFAACVSAVGALLYASWRRKKRAATSLLVQADATSSRSLGMALPYIGRVVQLTIDRPLGSRHPTHGFIYPVNYGHVPGTRAPDGEELDAYYLLVDQPLQTAEGRCIAVVHRRDDDDDKLVIVPNGTTLGDEEIASYVRFQEQWFDSIILRGPLLEGDRVEDRGSSETENASQQLAEAEARLGISLPLSFRRFLLRPQRAASVGEGGDACALRSLEELCWARDDAELLAFMAAWDEGASAAPEVSEAEHRATDDPAIFRRAFVDGALLISHVGAGFLLLNPAVVGSDGEFEAWHFAPWYPGAARWPNFAAMLASLGGAEERASFEGADERAELAFRTSGRF